MNTQNKNYDKNNISSGNDNTGDMNMDNIENED
jgi:hypothetical protein